LRPLLIWKIAIAHTRASDHRQCILFPRSGEPTMSSRHVLLSILAFLFAGFASSSVAAQELKFGFTPVLSEPEMRAEFKPLMTYLSDAIGQRVTLYIAKDYGDLRTQMENGSVDIGSCA